MQDYYAFNSAHNDEALVLDGSYRIVGADEADFERNGVSWLSPIAKALLNARLDQKVACKLPAGTTTLEIVRIAYE